jgi:hypothetical protein
MRYSIETEEEAINFFVDFKKIIQSKMLTIYHSKYI